MVNDNCSVTKCIQKLDEEVNVTVMSDSMYMNKPYKTDKVSHYSDEYYWYGYAVCVFVCVTHSVI